MLAVSVIVSTAACVLLGAYAILNYLCKQRIVAVREEIAGERENKARRAERLDVALARAVAEGKYSTSDLIDRWQSQRVEILSRDKTGQPWAWDDEDLAKWAKEEAVGKTEAIKRRTLVALALTTIILFAIAGGS